MTNSANEIKLEPIECFAGYDASISVDWVIRFTDGTQKKRIGFIGFYCSYDEGKHKFRLRVLKAYDAINKTYENWPDGEIKSSITFYDDDLNM